MPQSVLFIGNFLSSTGLNRTYSEDLSQRLAERGWDTVTSSRHRGRFRRLVDMVQTTWRYRRSYDVAHVDVFSGAAFTWAEVVSFELRQLRCPYVLTLRGGNLPVFARRWPTRTSRLLRSATLVTSPSLYLASEMSAFCSAVIIPNAVDVTACRFVHRTTLAPRLIWVRAFHEVYNPSMAVDVLAGVRRNYPRTTLTMLGPDKDGSRAAVEKRAKELGVSDALNLPGQVPKEQLPVYLANADIFLNTTDIDNVPVSVIEGMAAGTCVVSTNVGGIPYLLKHEETALLVPPRDPVAMTAAVVRLLQTPSLASKLSHQGHDLARVRDWSAVLPQWEETFSSCS